MYGTYEVSVQNVPKYCATYFEYYPENDSMQEKFMSKI